MVAVRGLSHGNTNKLGLFSEMGYTTIGEPYVAPYARPYNESASKGKQMLTAATKSRTSTGDGYFTKQFVRVFEKEAYSDVVKKRRQDRIQSSKKNIVPSPFRPSDATKAPSGVGSYYGTFGINGKLSHDYFKTEQKERPPHTAPRRNFISNPPKKGSGYGYVGVTIGEYARNVTYKVNQGSELEQAARKRAREAMVGGPFKLAMHPKPVFTDNPFRLQKSLPPARKFKERLGPINATPFKPTSPSKKPGNCKAGTFSKYPLHPVDGYGAKVKRPAGPRYGVFNPPTVPKSRPTDSLLRRSVNRRLNTLNYTTTQSVF